RGRGPLALRPGRHRLQRHDRDPADDRVEGAPRGRSGVNPELPSEALDLADSAGKAFTNLGGVDLARRAEDDPTVRATEVRPALDALGVHDLDPRDDPISLAAAAALCEAAGRVALPFPVSAALVRDADGRPTVTVPDVVARVD